MDNKQFTEQLRKQTGLEKQTLSRLTADLTTIISESLVATNTVAIQGFGIFESRKKNERISVSPTTGKRMLIPPKITVSFKPSSVIKNNLKDIRGHEQETES